ncbi:restriction endonuclease subunit S [Acinetobacter baumannii]|uniref:restriction endonuclease subunit S n=1 Tax=Acinetobacter baumannii TaxID=470 RepID=UPI003891C40C
MTFPLIKFTDIVQDKSGGNKKLPQEFFLIDGQYPVVDQSKKFIAGYINDQEYLVKSTGLPVVIFGDHTKAIKYVDFPFAMGADGVKVLKPKDECDTKYLYHYLRYAKIPDAGYSRHFKFLKELEIPLPPLAEQRRIASILDQADELRQKRQQAIEKLDQLLQATFIDMFGDPVSNSKKWTEKTLGEVVVFNTGKLDSNAAEENGIYPFFTCSRTPFAINTYAFDIEALLLAGNNAAGQYWVKHYKGKFNAYQRTYVLTIKDSLCTYGYLRYVLQFLLGFLQRMSKGSSTKYLTLSILKPIKIPIPPLELQRKFIQFYENIDSQNQLLMRNEIEFSKLFFTLQNQAFNGTL